MTTRTMYDGINSDAAGIARFAPEMVAYYTDGRFAWNEDQVKLFPHAEHVTITVFGNVTADVADVETGNMTPGQGADWVRNKRARGYTRPTIYCSRFVIPAVRAATGVLVLGVDYDIWCADYTGKPHMVTAPGPGPEVPCAAVQYENTPRYDVSAVYDDGWPHRTAAPVKLSKPAWPSGDILKLGSTGPAVYALQQAFHNSGIYGVRGLAEDGDFGPDTQTAVRNFEAEERLTVDAGEAGTQVRNRLISLGLLNQDGEYAR